MKKICLLIISALFTLTCFAAEDLKTEPTPLGKETQPAAPVKIDIKPTARDDEIRIRLEGILQATGWFTNPQVQVKEGVAFLNGTAKSDAHKKWAGDLARNTQDVSAVVNKLEVTEPSIWDFAPTLAGLRVLWRDFIRVLPTIIFAIFVLCITWGVAKLAIILSRKILKPRISSQLLEDVISRAIGVMIFILGFYIIFKMMGLTNIALTIIGGTGALGIIIGIAFKDITENLLASIFLSIHHPFRNGDLVEITEIQGYVQRLTIRSTVLMSLDGNHVQIPNATVYKSNIRNFSVNPNRQEAFDLAIGYDVDITKAQEIALKVLAEHPAVLQDPEPWILVNSLVRATVILRIYFWVDGSEHSWLKVRSSVMRLIKRAFQAENIPMPGDQYQLFFPGELPVRLVKPEKIVEPTPPPPSTEPAPVATSSEAGLKSESEDIQEQARRSRTPEKGEENLLNGNSSPDINK